MDSKRELRTFQKTVATAGTRVALSATRKTTWKAVVKALPANTGIIYVGDSTVSSSVGYPLKASESIEVSGVFAEDNFIVNLAEIYVDATVNGEGVSVAFLE